jgi:hypothetical protein
VRQQYTITKAKARRGGIRYSVAGHARCQDDMVRSEGNHIMLISKAQERRGFGAARWQAHGIGLLFGSPGQGAHLRRLLNGLVRPSRAATCRQHIYFLIDRSTVFLSKNCLSARGARRADSLPPKRPLNGLLISSEQEAGGARLHFVIGPAEGLPIALRPKAQENSLSLGKLTFPHQFARVLLVEQIYRAHEIRRGSGYHKT